MSNEATTLNLPKDMVESLVRDRLNLEIAQALGGKEAFAERIVGAFLNLKAKEEHSYREIPLIEKICRETLVHELRGAVKEWLADNVEIFRAEITRQLSSKKIQKEVASALIGTLAASAANEYRTFFKLQFVTEAKEED